MISVTEIKYEIGNVPEIKQIIEVYNSSGINRPTDDFHRIEKMYTNSSLIVSAWIGNKLIGISRSLTDFCYACYLSDLAVKKEYQKYGIGRRLIELTKREIGETTTLILLSAPDAMEYYPKVGFDKAENGFIIQRNY